MNLPLLGELLGELLVKVFRIYLSFAGIFDMVSIKKILTISLLLFGRIHTNLADTLFTKNKGVRQ